MSVTDASELLGVSVRQVQRLASSGVLTQVAVVGRTKLIDAASVQRLKARGMRLGRPWKPDVIAATIDLLTHGHTTRLTPIALSRLRARLAVMSAEDLVRAMHSRADIRRYRASASFLDRVRQAVTLTGTAAVDGDSTLSQAFGLVRSSQAPVDGYIDEKSARALIRENHLVEDEHGNITLRITGIEPLRTESAVVVALDLADSLDPRQRAAGLKYLRRRLKTLR